MIDLNKLKLGKVFSSGERRFKVVERNRSCNDCVFSDCIECLNAQCDSGQSGNDVDVKLVEIKAEGGTHGL